MKKIAVIFSLVAGTFIMAKCTPKAGKAVAETKTTAPAPPETPATPPTATVPPPAGTPVSAADIAAGKSIYNDNCGKCHKLYDPGAFTAAKWGPILKGMIPKARLNDSDGNLVRAYVYSNAKQG